MSESKLSLILARNALMTTRANEYYLSFEGQDERRAFFLNFTFALKGDLEQWSKQAESLEKYIDGLEREFNIRLDKAVRDKEKKSNFASDSFDSISSNFDQ